VRASRIWSWWVAEATAVLAAHWSVVSPKKSWVSASIPCWFCMC